MPTRAQRQPRTWLVETGPLGFAVVRGLSGGGDRWQLAAAVAGAAALSLGGSTRLSRRAGGALVAAGLALLLAAAAPAVVTRPLAGLLLLLLSIALLARAWSPGILEDLIGRSAARLRAEVIDVRLAAAVAVATWLIGVAARSGTDPWIAGASAAASLLAGARALAWTRAVLERRGWALWAALAGVAAVAAAATAAVGAIGAALAILVLMPAATLAMARARGIQIIDTSWVGLVVDHPARLVVTTFLFLCVAGFVLLSLPVCAAGRAIAPIDSAFTAVSAACVTGLITEDTPRAWSGPGQAVLLVLIQLGGLGIMTLSTAALGALGRRLSVRHEEAIAGLLGSEHRGRLFQALHRTLAVTAAAEVAGASILAVLFWTHGDGLAAGLWRGLFTAVSAFCNAGFALQSDSLIGYRSSPAVLHTVALLVVAGGLSPAVIVALPRLARRRVVPLQVKVVVVATAALLAFGFVSFAGLEWNRSLAGLSLGDRLHGAWFQSVTFRTAGFNSVDFGHLGPATLLVAFVLMFVGGAPGGTAGGIKVTTVWVLGAAVAGALGGRAEASSFGRRISHHVVYRAVAITAIGGAVVTAIVIAMLLTQEMARSAAVFEVFSALGTVGLSIGGTGQLDGLGKILIMIAMFLGRVGPLTALLLLVERQHATGRDQLEENVEVG